MEAKYQGIVINEPLDSNIIYAARVLAASLGLVGYMAYYKRVFDSETDMRVWEDLYGRSVFFFLPCVSHYLVCSRRNDNISFFELESDIRWLFAIRLAIMGSTYGFLALAISVGKGITTPVLVLLLSMGAMRLHKAVETSSDGEAEQISPMKKVTHLLVFMIAVIGVGFQYQGDENEAELFDGATNF